MRQCGLRSAQRALGLSAKQPAGRGAQQASTRAEIVRVAVLR
jgi:hypothetical protein